MIEIVVRMSVMRLSNSSGDRLSRSTMTTTLFAASSTPQICAMPLEPVSTSLVATTAPAPKNFTKVLAPTAGRPSGRSSRTMSIRTVERAARGRFGSFRHLLQV